MGTDKEREGQGGANARLRTEKFLGAGFLFALAKGVGAGKFLRVSFGSGGQREEAARREPRPTKRMKGTRFLRQDSVRFTKHYTIDQARALLPQLRQWFAELDCCQVRLREAEARLTTLLSRHDDIGGTPANDLVRALADCKDTLHKFAERQIQIKDVDRGLVDFPSLRRGEEVFLCWEKDEEDIEYWHALDSGFAGRERL